MTLVRNRQQDGEKKKDIHDDKWKAIKESY